MATVNDTSWQQSVQSTSAHIQHSIRLVILPSQHSAVDISKYSHNLISLSSHNLTKNVVCIQYYRPVYSLLNYPTEPLRKHKSSDKPSTFPGVASPTCHTPSNRQTNVASPTTHRHRVRTHPSHAASPARKFRTIVSTNPPVLRPITSPHPHQDQSRISHLNVRLSRSCLSHTYLALTPPPPSSSPSS